MTSLRDLIDADHVTNEIGLMRDGYRGAILLVEGPDDAKFFEKVLAPGDTCRVTIAYGRPNAIVALERLRRQGLGQNLLLVVDADFWRITGEVPADPDIILTEFHDLEMDMIASNALDDVLRELCLRVDLDEYLRTNGSDVRESVLASIVPIGRLRFLNYRDHLNINFSSVTLNDFVSVRPLEISLSDYLAEALELSRSPVGAAEMEAAIVDAALAKENPFQIARGHDYLAVLEVVLKSGLANCHPALCEHDSLSTMMRLAYSASYFEAGLMSIAIRAWESANGFPILA